MFADFDRRNSEGVSAVAVIFLTPISVCSACKIISFFLSKKQKILLLLFLDREMKQMETEEWITILVFLVLLSLERVIIMSSLSLIVRIR